MKEFRFISCFEIKELLGKRADNELQFMETLEEVPLDSVYYHMHSYFLRHVYLVGQYPNDFANWAAIQVRDRVLGEKLGSVTPDPVKSLEDLRTEVIEIVDRHLSEIQHIPAVTYGEPFYFMKARTIQVDTGLVATTMKELVENLGKVDASSIYFHVFEARLREKKKKSDFAMWVEEALGKKALAERIEKIDCYMYSLEDLRKKIIGLCGEELER